MKETLLFDKETEFVKWCLCDGISVNPGQPMEVEVTINGQHFSFRNLLTRLDAAYQHEVEIAAKKMLKEKLVRLDDLIYNFKDNMKEELRTWEEWEI